MASTILEAPASRIGPRPELSRPTVVGPKPIIGVVSDLGMTERGPMREENGLAIVLGMAKSGVDSERTGRVGVFPAGASAAGQRAAKYLLALDVVIMLGLIGFGLGNLLAGAWRPPKIAPIWVVVVVLVAAGLPVVLRRFWPVAAFRGVLVAGVVAVLLGGQWAVALDIGLALYVVVAEQPRRRGILNLALALAVTLLAPLVSVGRIRWARSDSVGRY
jgi:hypothetical protein